MIKYIILSTIITVNAFCQYQEATITRTLGTNSVYPRQFPSMTIRKMNDKEYWLFESLNTNTIFHRQFPTYIIRKQNTYSKEQSWGVYRTINTNTVYVHQFPDRYISDLDLRNEYKDIEKTVIKEKSNFNSFSSSSSISSQESKNINNSYSYSRSLRSDGKPSYNPEIPE